MNPGQIYGSRFVGFISAANLERAEQSIQAAKNWLPKATMISRRHVLIMQALWGYRDPIKRRFGFQQAQRGYCFNVGDYGGTSHVSESQAERAIRAAEAFLTAIKSLRNK